MCADFEGLLRERSRSRAHRVTQVSVGASAPVEGESMEAVNRIVLSEALSRPPVRGANAAAESPGPGVAGAEGVGDGRAVPRSAVHGTTPLIVSKLPLIRSPVTTPESCHVPRDPVIPKEISSPVKTRFISGVARPLGAT